ncbi:MAG: D-glycero-beta-D-manno-heptose 1-phosphate adenylyltransferase [Candidatus Omnitrophota bacterium]
MRTSGTGIRLEEKIKSLRQLQKVIRSLKSQRKRIVFTNGCFDLLHYGHVKYLQDARNKGDALIVAVNSDASVRKLKGKSRPIVPEKDRARVIAGLSSVDFVVIFNQDTPLTVIQALKPDILVKGADWNPDAIVGKDFVESYAGKVTTIQFVKGLSTTNLIKKIASRA